MSAPSLPLVEIDGLSKRYPVGTFRRKMLHAVDHVSLTISEGECIGLVGESGCGKSTLARVLARLVDPTEGEIRLSGVEVGKMPAKAFGGSPLRRDIQVVFQDPTESLNPGFTVFQAIADPLKRLVGGTGEEIADRVLAALDDVGLPREYGSRYPHQLSGGQKARVGIARAIAVNPKLLVLDEPTSALDVSVQSLILNLLSKLQKQRNMSYLFVSHDLNVVRLLCDKIAVMYLGRIVEFGPSKSVYFKPRHPYTRALIDAIPDPERKNSARTKLEGSASSPIDPNPNACRFAGRCPVELPVCTQSMPTLTPGSDGNLVACHRAAEGDPS
ncbi:MULTISPECIES: ABC transporter ATP-binding protein [Rhizobium]|uniref:ATP-binding cassette domain-containing protein n=1 Tax=Rhizobium tropici TaxID=398 RepID=A0A6P1C6Q7_RHITR|nr:MULTISPECIES: ABC transporter ATP-binding protein [Rhizobium]AGB73861.1 putative peptide ABC transporter, ATP-binding protein [Rhizobium tropici CIAT 899]MBB4244510.1 oligopeptide/dipeptide ABC transporter ATP-binding protein [Rhizobium tropici]MBB5595712.1 oligopeptide/dipeptide ABC transporter ATP-binding protein [Rhizobium tropici]MBB6494850.1 oligopeptide/dipeptide ABC transporter ATP-binding protein [Rhizobium tropici]NEV12899.1 ATP-binding cassette domain-containing protein [Rhizobium